MHHALGLGTLSHVRLANLATILDLPLRFQLRGGSISIATVSPSKARFMSCSPEIKTCRPMAVSGTSPRPQTFRYVTYPSYCR